MTDRIENLNEIVAVLKEGEKFYRDAAGKVDEMSLKTMFARIADERHMAVADLESRVLAAGAEPATGSFVEGVRAFYGKAAASLGVDSQLIGALEEHEDRTLEVIREAIDDPANAADLEVLRRHLAVFSATHDQMRALKRAA